MEFNNWSTLYPLAHENPPEQIFLNKILII